jgi:hypothetical protein
LLSVTVGLAAGFVWVWRTRARGPQAGDPQTLLTDLDEQAAQQLDLLRDLDNQQARLLPEEYAAQKSVLEMRTAAVLRQRQTLEDSTKEETAERVRVKPGDSGDGEAAAAAQVSSPTPPAAAVSPWWGAAAAAALGALWLVLGSPAPERPEPRQQPAPQATATGQSSPKPLTEVADPETQSLLAHLRDNPNDVPALVRATHLLLRGSQVADAKALSDRALALQPDNAEAQVHAAVLTGVMGEMPKAVEALMAVLEKHPNVAEGWLFVGMFSTHTGNRALMQRGLEEYAARAPDSPEKQRVQAMLRHAMPQATTVADRSGAAQPQATEP